MTPEQINQIRQNASVAFLQKVWEGTAQIGMNSTADFAEAQARLAEAEAQLKAANAKIEELTPKPPE